MITRYDDCPLAGRNSFGVEARARHLAEFDSADDLPALFESLPQGEPWYVMGGGNNILFTRDYEGTLLIPRMEGIEPVRQSADHVWVRVEAGCEWDVAVAWAVEHGLWGLENLSLIPGKAGAAPVQNIGAYGVEAKDVLEEVEMYCPATRNRLILTPQYCAFGYRDSVFKGQLRGKAVITAITLRLGRRPQPNLRYGEMSERVAALGGPTLENIRRAVCAIRRRKLPDPLETGNAGSFFKNPVVERSVAERLRALHPSMPLYPAADPAKCKLAAGWLIEQAGLKGIVRGRVGVHPAQALVLVNRGGASGEEVMALAREVQERVRERFGVEIETEVNIL